MMCQTLQNLFNLCRSYQFDVIKSDVVRVTCQNCQQLEVCPALSSDEYESRRLVNIALPDMKKKS